MTVTGLGGTSASITFAAPVTVRVAPYDLLGAPPAGSLGRGDVLLPAGHPLTPVQ
jgi:hypothetical protein